MVCCAATLSDFGLLYKSEALIELRKMLILEKNVSTYIHTVWELTELLDRRSVLNKLFLKSKKGVLFKLVVVRYP